MTCVLIVDDDKDVRQDILLKYWIENQKMDSYLWLERWPTLFLEYLKEHPEITHISFDHDLGHTDVSVELAKLIYFNSDDLEEQLAVKTVVIHSMNSVGSENIFRKLRIICPKVYKVPLCFMK